MESKPSHNQADNTSESAREKDNAYWERNQLVAALSKLFPSYLSKHPDDDKDWDDDWRTIVNIDLPPQVSSDFAGQDKQMIYQMSWHIHDHDIPMFDHLRYQEQWWDGHTTEEKYRRLRTLIPQAYRPDSVRPLVSKGVASKPPTAPTSVNREEK